MHQKISLYSVLALAFAMGNPSYAAGAGHPKKTSGTEQPAFVVPNNPDPALQPPIEQDASATPAAKLDYDTELSEHPLGRGTPGLALLMGGAFQHTGAGWDTAPTLAARYYFAKENSETEGPEALSPWSLELGAVLPHVMSGNAGGSAFATEGSTVYNVRVSKFSSEHVAVQYRWAVRWPFRMTPDVSLGVSVAQFENDFTAIQYSPVVLFPFGSTSVSAIGPLARLGLPLFANDWFAFRMEMGYIHYSETVMDNGHSFHLTFSGLSINPSIQISIGYLHSGVEKAVYLPTSSLPLWALTALQTEKRSPIIAPPEVLLNAHQAATQGGLSGNVLFQYKNRAAQKVELLADFNQWKPEPMYLDAAHVWVTVKDLKAGPYHYVYLVNGKREVKDPWNTSFDPSRRAHGSSVFVVPEVSPNVE